MGEPAGVERGVDLGGGGGRVGRGWAGWVCRVARWRVGGVLWGVEEAVARGASGLQVRVCVCVWWWVGAGGWVGLGGGGERGV